ncbi:hypothetical protein [Corynebacterium variabile]|uniref:hypothetical protein n=1 Tax=Corynebacterium variabile TaxID=1727 RepID=UPI00289D2741|nr:hypothetical protein [Corynebacterium variabile]
MIDGSVVLTFMGGLAGSLALVLVARVKLTGDRDAARGPDWQAYADRQAKELDGLKDEMREVRGEVRTLENRLDALERKYRSALAFIRHLLGAHPQHRKDTPTEIEADL